MTTKAYRLSCINDLKGAGVRMFEIGFNSDMEAAFSEYKTAVRLKYPNAHAFMIESDQDSPEIRKSWGIEPEINHCDHGHETFEQVRLLPTSSGDLHGNIICCKRHFQEEMNYRLRLQRGHGITPDLPRWDDLKIYTEE